MYVLHIRIFIIIKFVFNKIILMEIFGIKMCDQKRNQRIISVCRN